MAEVTITVYGTPAPQGSKRAFAGKDGKVHVIESSHDRVKSWRQAVIDEALKLTVPDLEDSHPVFPLQGPLVAEMTFFMPRPKSHYRTGRNAHLLKDSAPGRPDGKPDLSKLLRATEDALTDVGLWADDAQVTQYTLLAKVYADYRPPGATITVWPWKPVTVINLGTETT